MTTMTRADLGRELPGRALQLDEGPVRTGHEEAGARVGRQLGRVERGGEEVDRSGLDPRHRVEADLRDRLRHLLRAADDGGVLLVEHDPDHDRAADRDRRLDVGLDRRRGVGGHDVALDVAVGAPGPAVAGAVLLRVGVDDDRHVRAPGVEELAHEELAGLGRAAPVDVAAVVTRLVLAQRVEGEVAHRDVLGGAALEVAQQPGAERLEGDGARVDEELGALGPRQGAAHQAERVALHGRRGADLDDAAARGRDDEELLVRVAGGQRRQHEARGRQAHGQLDEDRQHRRARLVGDEDAAGRGVADDDPARVDLGEDADLGAAEREDEADERRGAGPPRRP